MLAKKQANATRQNNLIYKPNQLVLFSEVNKQTDAVLTPHIVLEISPEAIDTFISFISTNVAYIPVHEQKKYSCMLS